MCTSTHHLADFWMNGHHQRYWVSDDTGEKVADAYAVYRISPKESRLRNVSRAEFLMAVSVLFGTVFTNKHNDFKARFSKNTANKISSDKAITKSVVNGFTVENHFEVAKNIKAVFEQAEYIGMFDDKKHDPNVLAVHRFQKKIELSDGKGCFVFLMLKEVKKDGMRLYTFELMANKYPLRMQGNKEPRLLQANDCIKIQPTN